MTNAKANKSAQTKAPSAAEMEAFMVAKQAEKAALDAANAAKAPATGVDYAALGKTMLNHICKVVKGKNHNGELVKVFFVSKGRAGTDDVRAKKPIARIELANGEVTFMGLTNMEVVKPMDQGDIDRLSAAQKAESEETLYVAATCRQVGDQSIKLSNNGWWKDIWFPKSQCSRCKAVTAEGIDIYEVPAWKIRQAAGNDSYENAKRAQVELEKLVAAAG